MQDHPLSDTSVKEHLQSLPDWERLNAYDRTQHCCVELLRRGLPIPSWTSIRDLIGKGSSGDINQAKADYRNTLAQTLRDAESIKGVPAALVPHVAGIWKAAQTLASAELERLKDEMHQEALAAAQQAEQATQRLQDTLQVLELAEQKLSSQAQVLEMAQRENVTLTASLAQADGHLAQMRQDLATERESVQKAITRLEGVENHTLMRVEAVRAEEAAKLASATAKLTRSLQDQQMDSARVRRQITDITDQHAQLQREMAALGQAHALLVQTNADLKARAERAEALVQKLTQPANTTPARVRLSRQRALPRREG